MYKTKILADSVSTAGKRLTTLEVTFPRIVLAEFNTHRMLSRNSASSRAIPISKRIAQLSEDPFIPEGFWKNQKGMEAGDPLDEIAASKAKEVWYTALQQAIYTAKLLAGLEVHKQWAARLLEPFSWHTVIVTATEWDNFFALRCNKAAQPEIRRIAEMMREELEQSIPRICYVGEWHLPLVGIDPEDSTLPIDMQVMLSVARCARVSYLTHDGKRDVKADLDLYNRLLENGHLSPFEHAACAMPDTFFYGNFQGWKQHRKFILGEAVFNGYDDK